VTLLEALVALVILGLASLGFLGAFQAATNATREAVIWVQAVDLAEAMLEQTKLGTVLDASPATPRDGFRQAISVEPWPGAPGVERITVTVRLPDGGSFQLERLAVPR